MSGFNKGAIETVYSNTPFKSRLEARWAVFFDAAGIEWIYEPDPYTVDDEGTRYTPDFYLPKQRMFVEIKPDYPSKVARYKAEALEKVEGRPVLILWGAVQVPGEPGHASGSGIVYTKSGKYHDQLFAECTECGMIAVRVDGRLDKFPCTCWKDTDEEPPANAFATPKLRNAYAMARRFRAWG